MRKISDVSLGLSTNKTHTHARVYMHTCVYDMHTCKENRVTSYRELVWPWQDKIKCSIASNTKSHGGNRKF